MQTMHQSNHCARNKSIITKAQVVSLARDEIKLRPAKEKNTHRSELLEKDNERTRNR